MLPSEQTLSYRRSSLGRVAFRVQSGGAGLNVGSDPTRRHRIPACSARWWPWLLLVLAMTMHAQDFSYTTNGGTITITDYTGAGGVVVVPGMITGLPVTAIGDLAFYNTAVTNITIPDSVTTIGDQAFSDCYALTSITIPNSVTNIGDYAFNFCLGLTNVTIPSSVPSLGNSAFASCWRLTSVTIPAGVTNIGTKAFTDSRSLTNVTMLNGVATIGDSAFATCLKLTTVVLPNSVVTIGNNAFSDCRSLTNLTIPNGLTSIGRKAFYQCWSLTLTSPALPNSVTTIGDSAFDSCIKLKSVTIPSSLTTIGASAFLYCSELTNLTVEAANPAYSSREGVLFDKSGSTLIVCPGGKAGDYAIPSDVTTIKDSAFFDCELLTSVAIPTNVANIGKFTFYTCIGLTNITIPDSVTAIGDSAFYSCTGLANVIIPKNVTNIVIQAFAGCSGLTSITVDAANSAYRSVEGVLFNKGGTTLVQWPGGKGGNYTVPDGVTRIGSDAFSGCTNLTTVTIPAGVTNMDQRAFSGCGGLTGLYFNGNAPKLGSSVFTGANQATVFSLAETTGWAATYGGLTTSPWLPRVLTEDAGFGLHTNRFGFNLAWASGRTVLVEATPDLVNPVWTPVATNTLTGEPANFSDPDGASHPARFYRLRSP
jgi:hypothetical protein